MDRRLALTTTLSGLRNGLDGEVMMTVGIDGTHGNEECDVPSSPGVLPSEGWSLDTELDDPVSFGFGDEDHSK